MIVLATNKIGFWGGVERFVFDLARGLRQAGHQVGLIHAGDCGREPDRFTSAFDEVRRLDEAQELLRHASGLFTHKLHPIPLLQAAAGRCSIAIAVHDHDFTCVRSHRYLPGSHEPCTRPPGIGCVVHGCVVVRRRSSRRVGLASPFRLASNTRQLAELGQLVAGSAFLRRTLLDAGVPPTRVSVLHPVPPEDPSPVVQSPSDRRLGFAGQLVRGKGLDILLRAMTKVPSTRLVVAGDGSDRFRLLRLTSQCGIRDRVELLGSLPPEQVASLYDRCRLVVVPSRWPEPFGMVGIEAMRRARPVIAAWHGGIPEWLAHGENGLGFRPGDVDDLAHALRSLLDQPQRYEEMARTAVRSVADRFSFQTMLKSVIAMLSDGPQQACQEEMLAGGPSPGKALNAGRESYSTTDPPSGSNTTPA